MKITNISHKRNTFKTQYFQNINMYGYFNFPLLDFVEKQSIKDVVPFNVFKSKSKSDSWIHFFIDDYQFERLWNNPTQYLEILKRAQGVITTDFSMYADMPRAMQIYNCYRNRALAKYFQLNAIKIIPAVGWSDKQSFAWCFDGIPEGSAVAISTNGCLIDKNSYKAFLEGFNAMIDKINPCQIVIIGKIPEELKNNDKIICFGSFSEKFIQKE